MTSHSPATDLSQDQPSLPNQHFSSWLRGQTTLFVSQIVAVLGIILFIAEEVYYVAHASEQGKLLDPPTVKLIVDYAHVVFMAVFIMVLIKVLDDNDRGWYRVKLVYARVFKEPKGDEKNVDEILETSKDQLRKFKRRFLWFWIGMLFLYVAFALQHNYQARHKVRNEPAGKEVTLSFDGKIHGEQKFEGELSLNVTEEAHGVTPANHAGDDEKPDSEVVHTNLVFAFITFFFNNFTLLFVFLCFLVMYIKPGEEKKEWKYMVGAVVVVGSLIVLFLWFLVSKWGTFTKETAGTYASVFDALSGVINAVVLALLIARLDSKLVGLPPWLISILYSYAAVQPLFLVFELSHSKLLATITTLVLIFVFMSKIYFFLIIFYALQTGKMLNYLTCFPILRKRAGAPPELAAQRKSVYVRFAEFDRSAPHGPAEWYRRVRRWRAHVLKRARGSPPQRISGRLGLLVSDLLSRYSLHASKVIGWAAILYFFCALISSQVLPETQNWGGGLWSNIVFVVSKFLRPPPSAAFGINVAHLVFLALMIVTLCLILEINQFDRKTAAATAQSIFNDRSKHEDSITEGETQIKKFKKYFLYFWCVTFLLYAVFLFEPLIDLSGYKGSSWSPVIDPSGCEGPLWPLGVLGGHEEGTFGRMVQELLFPTLGFVFASLNLMYAYRCFVVLRSPAIDKSPGVTLEDPEMMHKHLEAKNKRLEARQKLLINYSTFGVYLLIAVYLLLLGFLSSGVAATGTLTETLRDYATMFDGVTGLLSAIVLALLIARMDSKLFSLPSRLIWLLFVYASIQSLYIIFAQTNPVLEMVREAVLHAALGLKICFFLIVAHSLQSGRMLNYLVSFPLLRERVDSIFENQFEIRLARVEDNEFTFSILKKNRLRYTAAETFESREQCDWAVEELRSLMKKSKPYGAPRHSAGTYWVEVRSGNKLVCESIPLRSAEEALDLMDESMGKVPYCKYNRL